MDKINVRCYLKSVKQYNEKVLDFILFLFKDITKKRWEWEYLHSPSKSIVKVCTHNNNIIGHYALILFPMLLSGRVVSGGKAEGSLVDINAIRRLQKADRNVFGKLIKSCLSEFSCHKKFAVFGFPNSKALTSQLKHGYECIKVEGCEKIFFRDALYTLKGVNKYIKPLLTVLSISYTKIVDFFITLLFSNTSAISKISENDIHDLNIFSLKISRKYPHTLMIHRTYQYFKWRILDNPYAYGNVLLSKSKDGDLNSSDKCITQ